MLVVTHRFVHFYQKFLCLYAFWLRKVCMRLLKNIFCSLTSVLDLNTVLHQLGFRRLIKSEFQIKSSNKNYYPIVLDQIVQIFFGKN